MQTDYHKDFYGWCQEQARILKENNWQNLPFDFDNLAEEIRDVGEAQKNNLISYLCLLFCHILKWQYQPSFRSRSWLNTIKYSRDKAKRIIKKNPSLQSALQECIEEAYEDARFEAAKQTQLDLDYFPEKMTFDYEFAMEAEIEK